MQRSPDVTEVEISAEMKALLDQIPDTVNDRVGISFTAEDDRVILEFFHRKKQPALAKVVGYNPRSGRRGCSVGTLRNRYDTLVEGLGHEQS